MTLRTPLKLSNSYLQGSNEMSLPKNLKIFGLKFKVKVTALNGILGLCDRSSNTIYIEQDQPEKEMWHTLLHELGHAVFGRIGLIQGVNHEIEEIIVDSLATAILENLDVGLKGSIPPEIPEENKAP